METIEKSDNPGEAATAIDAYRMRESAGQTTAFLKSLSHPVRLEILCRLAEGEARVNQLEEMLAIPQAQVSKQLARLREEGLVDARREGRTVVYALGDARARRIIGVLYQEFCASA